MDNLVKYWVLVIVVWRLTHLISAEDGPFDLIIKVRKLAGNSFFGKLMDCFYCLSIWMGLLAALYMSRDAKEIVLLCLYYSGAAILLEKITNKNFN
jgi:lipoprotein signal peptidase